MDKNSEKEIDFKAIVDHLDDGIYVADKNGKTIYVNNAYLKMAETDRDSLMGRSVSDLNEEKKLFYDGVIPDVLKYKKRMEKIGTITATNNKLFVTGIPIFDEWGQIRYAVAEDKDMRQLMDLQQQLEKIENIRRREAAEIQYLRNRQLHRKSIVFESESMKAAMITARAVAGTDVTVLITGESGTGKEVIADEIYSRSPRNSYPFMKINCSALSESLLESELFGYEAGAFTGASKKGKAGLFEVANDGMILLDEIGDMPLNLQTKLLRVLQQKEILRIGGKKVIKLNIRIIAATNKNLLEEIKKGNFREDLYYRLNVVPIHLAPLRERTEDIEPLISEFLSQFGHKYGRTLSVKSEAAELMKRYSWPGNIRELENIIERLAVIAPEDEIDASIVAGTLGITENSIAESCMGGFHLKTAVENLERELIKRALEKYGTKRKAAKAMGIDHSTLVKKCRKLGIR